MTDDTLRQERTAEIQDNPQPGLTCSNVEAAEIAAVCLADLRDNLEHLGYDRQAILAGFHAQIAAMLTCTFGGNAAAERMRSAADEVRGHPSAADALARIEAMGNA